MGGRVTWSGLVVAGIGFSLTRFTVTLTIYETPLGFYLAGIIPLVLGLGLAAFGVALAVADIEPRLVRTVTVWCAVGTGTMLVLVMLTLLGASSGSMPTFQTARAQTYLSNFLIVGSVGGTLTGLYAGHNRRQRETLRQQANRLKVLNRLLRHEVINSVSVIQGYARFGTSGDSDAQQLIETNSEDILETIERVKYLTRNTGTGDAAAHAVDAEAHLEESVQTIRERYPEATVSVGSLPTDLTVVADEQLRQVFTHLLENAIVHAEADRPTVEVSADVTGRSVRVHVRDQGPGLPEAQQELLERGAIDEFDNPNIGFGLNIVRLLVESYGGTIETDAAPEGTTVTVALPRPRAEDRALRSSQASLVGVRPTVPHLLVTLATAIVAGLVYGIVAEQLGGSVAFIGVYYGIQHPVVGWLTHEFHSVVFGFMFAGLVSLAPRPYRNHLPAYIAAGAAWGLALWFVAAGFVSPVWLRLLGMPTSIPTLSPTIAVPHLVWGVVLGALTAVGYERVAPWLARRLR